MLTFMLLMLSILGCVSTFALLVALPPGAASGAAVVVFSLLTMVLAHLASVAHRAGRFDRLARSIDPGLV